MNKETLWCIIAALLFILLNAYFYDRHNQKLEKMVAIIQKQNLCIEKLNGFGNRIEILRTQINQLHNLLKEDIHGI